MVSKFFNFYFLKSHLIDCPCVGIPVVLGVNKRTEGEIIFKNVYKNSFKKKNTHSDLNYLKWMTKIIEQRFGGEINK